MCTTILYHCLPAPITDEFGTRAMYDKDLGKESRGWGYVNPNTRVHYDQVERKGEAWRKSNPTAETVIDDSFGRIFGDFFSGIGTLGRSGFGGGRDLLESIVELMESMVIQFITPPPPTDSQ